MKAPDKIYIDGDIIPFNSINERLSDKDVEYIRKDALLEWLNEMLVNTENALDFRANCVYGKVIDKLNSV